VLGGPDNGVILSGYIGSWLMAGAFLAIGAAVSALTKNQVIAFVVAAVVCFLLTVSGSNVVLGFFTGWAPQPVVDTVASFSFISHFTSVMRGVIDLKDMVYFISLIVFFLFANTAIVELKKAD
jgi:ABC-2 type transport system permease protein